MARAASPTPAPTRANRLAGRRAATTVITAVALVFSLDAVIVTVPGATAVTRPLGATRATSVLVEAQLTGRLPSASPRRPCS